MCVCACVRACVRARALECETLQSLVCVCVCECECVCVCVCFHCKESDENNTKGEGKWRTEGKHFHAGLAYFSGEIVADTAMRHVIVHRLETMAGSVE